MGGARVVGGLAGPVEVAERAELVGGVPRVEGQARRPRRLGARRRCRGRGAGIVSTATGTGGATRSDHSTAVSSIGVCLVVDRTLDAQLEADVAGGEPRGDLVERGSRGRPERRRRGRRCRVRGAADSARRACRPSGSRRGSSRSRCATLLMVRRARRDVAQHAHRLATAEAERPARRGR